MNVKTTYMEKSNSGNYHLSVPAYSSYEYDDLDEEDDLDDFFVLPLIQFVEIIGSFYHNETPF